VIFSITFPYDPEDRVFAEELASRIRDFRQAALEYFGSFPAEELRSLDEDEIKTELLRRYNALLRLGRIEVLYISDFMIF
jgi:flagellar basal body-associated protein FliL